MEQGSSKFISLIKAIWPKILFTVVILGILIGVYIIFSPSGNASNGAITVIVVTQDGERIIDDEICFEEGDSFLSLLKDNYDVVCEVGSVGTTVLGINGLLTDFRSTYLAFYVNGEYSNFGVDSVELVSGNSYMLKEMVI